ncbi:MAG: hypothetical protein GX571_08780 [Lentisphaerae bacterium]|nr:hypothetical protein [Lentisphaerota bacterium]
MTILSRTRGGWLWMALLAAASAFAGRDADSPRIGQLPLDGQWVPADLRIAIVGPDWQDVVYLDTAALLQHEAQPGGSLWRAELPAGTLGGGARLEQRVRRVGDDVTVEIGISNLGTQTLAGVFLMLNVPAPAFAGGSFRIDEIRGDLPLVPGEPHLRIREGTQCTLWNADGTRGISLGSDTLLRLLVQDGRRWGPEFSILATLHAGTPPPNHVLRHSLVLSALGTPQPPAPPGALALDPSRRLGAFDGFGGNFCFGLDEPVTEQVRQRLRPRVARLRMHLDDLGPPLAGSGDSHSAWMRMLAAADRPWSELWQNLGLAETLHRDGTRLQISTWRVPAWILDHPPTHDQNRIAPGRYDDLAGMVAAYLDYLRRSRGVVPETFSFNEPDWGANVIFTPDGYRDALLAVNQALRRHGLETRLMIGDLSTAGDGNAYLAPVLTNSTLMARAAGISFHAWNKAAEADYAAWRALADQTGLPLIVGEIGVDHNWRDVQLHGYDYALREMAHYLDVLRQARPQQVLYWEYGASYALLPPETRRDRQPESERLALQQHLVSFTPPGAEAITCHSPLKTVSAAAFAVPRGKHEGYTLHVANFGAETSLDIAGLPYRIRRLDVVETSQGVCFRTRRAVPCKAGIARVTLPALSLTTFTTR